MVGIVSNFRGGAPGLDFGISARAARTTFFDLSQSSLPAGLAFGRDSTALVWQENGTLAAVAADVPRFDRDPVTGAANGLLLEAGRSNLVPFAAATVANWIADSCTPELLALGALGIFPGVRVPSSGVVWSRLKQTCALAAGSAHAVTCFCRPGTSPNLRIAITGAGGETHVAGTTDSLTNTRSDLGPCTQIRSTLLKDGLSRMIRFLFTSTVGGNYQIGVGPATTAAGQDVVLLGIQVELAANPSRFIPSGASSGVRADESLRFTWLNGRHDLLLRYSDSPDTMLTNVQVAPGYVLPVIGKHLVSITARPG